MDRPVGVDTTPVSALNERKLNHIRICLDESVDLQQDSFAAYKLRYSALPEIDLREVCPGVEFAGKPISAPLMISCMTGGVGGEFLAINRHLASAAEELKIPLGLGSMKVLLKHPEALASFDLRAIAPSIPIVANLGLVSFNYGITSEHIDRIIDVVHPDVFGLHLNALQEAIQEGGDTNFRGLLKCLEEIVKRCPLPVYVKECGGGIAPHLVTRLADVGVAYVDVSGNDGTSWSAAEGGLSADPSLGELFKDFGLPTAWILQHLDTSRLGGTKIVAGGGIRNGIQAAKALALGAGYVSVARPFLVAATKSIGDTVEVGRRLIQELRTAMFLVGITRVEEFNRSLFI